MVRVVGVASWALILVACSSAPEAPRGRAPATIRIEAPALEVTVEGTERVDAVALDRHGEPIPSAPLTFESAAPSIASVDGQGWVRGQAPGETEITLRSGEAAATLPVRVRHQVGAVEIVPAAPHLLEDEAIQLEVVLFDRWGEPFEAELEALWRSEDPTIARVDADGMLRAIAPGTARIRATVAEGQGETLATVAPRAHVIELRGGSGVLVVGDDLAVRASILDRRGEPLERELAWSSSDPAVARVSEGGRVLAEAPGEAIIRAEVEGAVGELPIRVLPAVARVEILPDLSRLYVGGANEWAAHAYDADDQRLEGRPLLWSSETPEVATVSPHTGRVEAVAAGVATITARSGDVRGHAQVEVFPAPTRRFPIELPPRVEPVAHFPEPVEYLGPLPQRWRSSDPEVAAVEEGALIVRKLGVAVLTAEAGGLRTEVEIAGSLRFQRVAAGDAFACGISEAARVWCWGANDFGQLGNDGLEASPIPVRVGLDPELRVRAITAGSQHACALTEDGRAYCWGDNRSGELGAETDAPFSALPLASVPEERFAQLSAGDIPSVGPHPDEGAHTCGLSEDGRALCWGNGRVGQMGDGAAIAVSPAVEPSGGHRFVELRASAGYTCGLADDARIYCWGHGPLGTPARFPDVAGALMESTTPRLALYGPPLAPTDFPSVPDSFSSIALGQRHACALTDDHTAYCWGAGAASSLGTSGYTKPFAQILFGPVTGGSTPAAWQRLSAGSTTSCGLDPSGGLHCWGRAIGALDPDAICGKPSNYHPAPLLEDTRVAQLAIGRRYCEDFACALDDQGLVRCWGFNLEGQAGQPPSLRVPEPTPLFPD